jgi:hypothetical protein
MGLKETTIKAVEVIFTTLKDAVKSGQYTVKTDDGFDVVTSQSIPVRVILDKFRQEDSVSTSFSDLIQPTDSMGLVPGKDLTLAVKAQTILTIDERNFTIVAFETDSFEALYTLLLRDIR